MENFDRMIDEYKEEIESILYDSDKGASFETLEKEIKSAKANIIRRLKYTKTKHTPKYKTVDLEGMKLSPVEREYATKLVVAFIKDCREKVAVHTAKTTPKRQQYIKYEIGWSTYSSPLIAKKSSFYTLGVEDLEAKMGTSNDMVPIYKDATCTNQSYFQSAAHIIERLYTPGKAFSFVPQEYYHSITVRAEDDKVEVLKNILPRLYHTHLDYSEKCTKETIQRYQGYLKTIQSVRAAYPQKFTDKICEKFIKKVVKEK